MGEGEKGGEEEVGLAEIVHYERLKYIVVVATKLGVFCKSCGMEIELDDEYIPGVPGAEVAARLYNHLLKATKGKISDSPAWQKALICGNPGCWRTNTYATEDVRLYNG